jgi:5'-nucleotidase
MTRPSFLCLAGALLAGALAGCSGLPASTEKPLAAAESETATIAILGINDFHGHIQSAQPVPRTIIVPDPQAPDGQRQTAVGGAAYLATELTELRQRNPHSITVGVGDLIGASPLTSALLDDEPTIETLNRLGMSVSVVGNHEFDRGRVELERRIAGRCPESGCKLPEFHGARFDYLAANVLDKASGRPFLAPYVIREIDGIKVAFVGTPLRETPSIVVKAGIATLNFTDEASAINALIPEMQAQGARVIVALIHQGGEYDGPYNDPTYRCAGLRGPIVDIVRALDKAVVAVMSAHTHNGYTCKIDGRLLTQGYSFGALVSEIRLKIDRRSGEVLAADAENHPVDQHRLTPDAAMQQWVVDIEARSADVRNRPVGRTLRPLTRRSDGAFGDSPLGNLIADAQWTYARRFVEVDFALTNRGGMRADLPEGADGDGPLTLTFGDLFATQPFRSGLLVVELRGAEILDLLRGQWRTPDAAPYFLQVSRSLNYHWRSDLPLAKRVFDVRINGKPLIPTRTYRIAINSFLADGGDDQFILAKGRHPRTLPGQDIDALRWFIEKAKAPLDIRSEGRIRQEK